MSRWAIRTRLAMLCAGVVALAIVLACVVAWLSVRHTLQEQVDQSLSLRVGPGAVRVGPENQQPVQIDPAELTERMCTELSIRHPDEEAQMPRIQVILADGSVCQPGTATSVIEPTAAERAVAETGEGEVRRDAVTVGGERVRVATRPLNGGVAVQSIASLEAVDAALRQLAWILFATCLLGMLLAAAAGWGVARTALRPVGRLTSAAELVAATDDLDAPLAAPRGRAGARDEVARLAHAFNAMITRLGASRRRERELIADARHELRTPLTSLRTNVEWLMRVDDRGATLDPEERRRIERAVLGQVDELADLIDDLGRLARGEDGVAPESLDLDMVVVRAVERAQRRDPARRFRTEIEPTELTGDPAALERAVLNLLDNAMKFSSDTIRVSLHDGRICVADRGPGLTADQRDHAFERFWRAAAARGLPGSGLGLAIVADVAKRHGGEVFFEARDGGGSEVGLTLPARSEPPSERRAAP